MPRKKNGYKPGEALHYGSRSICFFRVDVRKQCNVFIEELFASITLGIGATCCYATGRGRRAHAYNATYAQFEDNSNTTLTVHHSWEIHKYNLPTYINTTTILMALGVRRLSSCS